MCDDLPFPHGGEVDDMDDWFLRFGPFEVVKVRQTGFIAMSDKWVVKGLVSDDDTRLEGALQAEANSKGAALPLVRSGMVTSRKLVEACGNDARLWWPIDGKESTCVLVAPRMEKGDLSAWVKANADHPNLIHILLVAAVRALVRLEDAEVAHQDAKCNNFVVQDHGTFVHPIDFELAVSKRTPNPEVKYITGFNFAQSYISRDLHRCDVAALYLSIRDLLAGHVWFRDRYDLVFLNGFKHIPVDRDTPKYVYRTEKDWLRIPMPSEVLRQLTRMTPT